jgi:hypothetical protein
VDDLIALIGVLLFLAGLYLWLGLPATLITFGLVLIYVGWRLPARDTSNGSD